MFTCAALVKFDASAADHNLKPEESGASVHSAFACKGGLGFMNGHRKKSIKKRLQANTSDIVLQVNQPGTHAIAVTSSS
jgi:hypothetical protein